MKKKWFLTTVLVALFCCLNTLPVSALSSNYRPLEESDTDASSLEYANEFLLNSGMTKDQLLVMNDVTKLNILQTFDELDSLNDNIEFKGTTSKTIHMNTKPTNGISPQNISPDVLEITNYSFHNHQMGRIEAFGEFEWIIQTGDQLLNNDSFSYAIDEGWNILSGSEGLSLYLYNGELNHHFTRPSNGNKYGASFRIANATLKEFRGIRYGVLHFSLRPSYEIPIGELSTYLELHYTQDVSYRNSISYSIQIMIANISVTGGGTNIHEAFYRTNLF